tara:strand:- start:10921 stop:12441 length:1521 start_codon:yes stop_codon:yes gene_type:complete
MSKLETIVLASPGFWGLNTQDSPLDMDVRFAADANNCVIDRKGRIAARKGTTLVSTNGAAVLGSSTGIEFMSEFLQEDGTTVQFSGGNNKLFTGTTTLVDATPAATTVTANNWTATTLNNKHYFFQSGHDPLVYTPSGAITRVQDEGTYTGTVPAGDVLLAAFGRLFVASTTADKSTVTWSDLLLGLQWTGGSSGSINLRKFWPTGYDEVTALIEHNNNLIIFGKRNILIFSGADSPSTMELADVIENIGCVARDSVQSTGQDILYLSASGLRTLGRTIQEKSAPIGDASKNTNDDLKAVYSVETGNIRGLYNEERGFYILSFPSSGVSYVFDVRYRLEDGSMRITTWDGLTPYSLERTDAGLFYIGTSGGIEAYGGFLDRAATTYTMDWLTHPLSFDSPGSLKFLKDIQVTFDNGSGYSPVVKWAWDYRTSYTKRTIAIPVNNIAEYGIGEYNISEYSDSIALLAKSASAGGSGRVLTAGMTIIINGESFSIQQFELQATMGRVL